MFPGQLRVRTAARPPTVNGTGIVLATIGAYMQVRRLK